MESLPETISQYDAGLLVIHPSNFSLKHCLPNKIFDCMAAGRAVIVGPSPDMEAFVRSNGVGIVASGFSHLAIREAVLSLKHDDILRYSRNAINTAKEASADSEASVLCGIIRTIISN